jgi:hypothetical protein
MKWTVSLRLHGYLGRKKLRVSELENACKNVKDENEDSLAS